MMFSKKMQRENAASQLFAAALVAISIVIIQDLISSRITDTATLISTIAIAIEVPFLAGCLSLNFYENSFSRRAKASNTAAYNTMYGIGLLSGFIGINAALWHISWIVGTVFLVCSIAALVISTVYHTEISKSDIEENEDSKGAKVNNQQINFNILTQEQEIRISIEQLAKMTTYELANILEAMSTVLRNTENITLDELKKRKQEEDKES